MIDQSKTLQRRTLGWPVRRKLLQLRIVLAFGGAAQATRRFSGALERLGETVEATHAD